MVAEAPTGVEASAVGLPDSGVGCLPVLALVLVALAVVVTVAAVAAVVVVDATAGVAELVVEAAVVDVEDGVEDAVRELWPVDGRLKIIYINGMEQIYLQITAQHRSIHKLCNTQSIWTQAWSRYC